MSYAENFVQKITVVSGPRKYLPKGLLLTRSVLWVTLCLTNLLCSGEVLRDTVEGASKAAETIVRKAERNLKQLNEFVTLQLANPGAGDVDNLRKQGVELLKTASEDVLGASLVNTSLEMKLKLNYEYHDIASRLQGRPNEPQGHEDLLREKILLHEGIIKFLENPSFAVRQTWEYFKADRYSDASRGATLLGSTFPSLSGFSQLLKGLSLWREGKEAEALEIFKTLSEKEPSDSFSQLATPLLAYIFLSRENYKEGLANIAMCIENAETDLSSFERWGKLSETLKKNLPTDSLGDAKKGENR